MSIQNIPQIFIPGTATLPELFIYDYKMTAEVVNSKVDLSLHLFSFLQTGHKKVHFADTAVAVNEQQSIIIKKGNCLITELLNNDMVYFCKLFFFSQKKVDDFLQKHNHALPVNYHPVIEDAPFFVIENDAYIKAFVQSLSYIMHLNSPTAANLLDIKFEEIMLYLLHKYGNGFLQYAQSLTSAENHSTFRTTVETYAYSNLKLEEIAFLCNMSLSTFKRHFIDEFKIAPGKWLQQKRLIKAKEILQTGKLKPSEIYADFGYQSLSNFSAAFKNQFGNSPNQISSKV
jgi:AraC family transcriptional regulator, exoenzyme S synthesis regulatory protein ExsA